MAELLQTSETFYQPSPDELVRFAREAGCGDNEALVPLAGGHHNVTYRYGDVVVRHPKNQETGAEMEAEFDLLRVLDGRCMPRAIAHTSIKGVPVALVEFIDGIHKDFNSLGPIEIEALCRAMCDIHSITSDRFSAISGAGASEEGTHGDYLLAMVRESVTDRLDRLARDDRCDLSAYGDAQETIDAGLRKLIRLLVDHPAEFSGRTFSLLHHDLNPGNVRWKPDGSVVFIDPNPTYGDPLDDVNYAITNNKGSAKFQRLLLGTYARMADCGKISLERMRAYTLKNWLDDLAWTIEMREKSPENFEYVAMYEHRLTALRELYEKAD